MWMILEVVDDASLMVFRNRASAIAEGPTKLTALWLERVGAVVLPQESASHFDQDQAHRVSAAFSRLGADRLVAVPVELDGRWSVYTLDATIADLCEFSFQCGSLNYLLLTHNERPAAILCTTEDYFLLAGPCQFVLAYAPNVEGARREFLEFVDGHFPQMQTVLQGAVSYWNGPHSPLRC